MIDEPSRVAARWDELQAELALRPAAYVPRWRRRAFAEIMDQLGGQARLLLSRVAKPSRHFGPVAHVEIDSASLEFFSQDLDGLSAEITGVAGDPELAELKQMVDVRGHIRRALDDLEEPVEEDQTGSPEEKPKSEREEEA